MASSTFSQAVSVTSAFDSGNGDVLSVSTATPGEAAVSLAIRPDPFCESDAQAHMQWFHFQISGPVGTALTIRVENAGACSYPTAWTGYNAVATYDLHRFFRVADTSYDAAAGVLTIRHTLAAPVCRFSYFAPFSQERHTQLVMRAQHLDRVQLHVLGRSVEGRELHMLQFGTPAPGKAVIWAICRQHPGESMASWWAEGLIERLTGRDSSDGPGGTGDPLSSAPTTAPGSSSSGSGGSGKLDAAAAALLDAAVVYLVPNCCPDGSVRGHLRTNAVGANLNREWADPSAERSPEVLALSKAITATGLDMLLDVHGDEEIPANFIGSMRGIPAWGPRLERMQQAFVDALLEASADFQTSLGYSLPEHPTSGANLSTASKANAQRFNTLSLVLEQPFKDCVGTPNEETGWSPQRAKAFGSAAIEAFLKTVPVLLRERATA